MDIVYIVGPIGSYEELRYSLRSLRNLPHDRVWIAGRFPKWVTNVSHISVQQRATKFQSSTENVRAAAAHPEVSDDFVFFNDDFFVMQQMDTVPTLHRGPVPDVEHRGTMPYRAGMEATCRLLEDLGFDNPLSYELHVPMVLNKERVLEALSLPLREGRSIPILHKRTLYGNYWRIGGRQVDDCKIITGTDPYKGRPFLSTSDQSFRLHAGGRYIQAAFPEPSPYER